MRVKLKDSSGDEERRLKYFAVSAAANDVVELRCLEKGHLLRLETGQFNSIRLDLRCDECRREKQRLYMREYNRRGKRIDEGVICLVRFPVEVDGEQWWRFCWSARNGDNAVLALKMGVPPGLEHVVECTVRGNSRHLAELKDRWKMGKGPWFTIADGQVDEVKKDMSNKR